MRQCTQQRAWQLISALGPVDAGRLTGRCLRHHTLAAIPAGTLSAGAAQTLQASVDAPADTPITSDTIFYVVSSDLTPVAWLTYDAQVVLPPAELTDYQLAHQRQARTALSQLTRHAVRELAVLRDLRDRRTSGPPPSAADTDTRILVAAAGEPTLTWWADISGDVAETRRHLSTIITGPAVPGDATSPSPAEDVLVLDAYGYGGYGRQPSLDLPRLCAIEQLAHRSGLPAWVIGDWLDLHGAGTADFTAARIAEEFDNAFAGVFMTRRAFAGAERDRHGWSTVLAAAGIPLGYFDLDAFAKQLFREQVCQVQLGDGSLAVFWRREAQQP